AKDAVVVAAAGNRDAGIIDVATPANIPGVIAVGATGKNGAVYPRSVSGAALGVVAPGEKMVTTGSRRAGKPSGYATHTTTRASRRRQQASRQVWREPRGPAW